MILKTEAIALSIRGFSNTSHIVVWLTPGSGRLTTLVKGACRSRSAFLGQYDLFYSCELLYYARDHDGLHIARECTPLDPRPSFRSDWRAMLCASYACALLDPVAENSPPGGLLFSLLRETLDRLAGEGAGSTLLLWFETRLLQRLGLSPAFNGCPRCHEQQGHELRFAVADGRVVCPECSGKGLRSAVLSLSRDAVDVLRRLAQLEVPEPALPSALNASEHRAIRRFLGVFMRYHLDSPLAGRSLAWDACDPTFAVAPPLAPNPVAQVRRTGAPSGAHVGTRKGPGRAGCAGASALSR